MGGGLLVLHEDAMPDGRTLARQFRKEPTLAEELLWKRLRAYRLTGLKFRRQHPLGGAIADFYCAERQLVVEVDGEGHNHPENRERDELRDEIMRARGLTVLRFTNDQVLNDLESSERNTGSNYCLMTSSSLFGPSLTQLERGGRRPGRGLTRLT